MSLVRSLGRGLEVLDLLTSAADRADADRTVGVTEIARAIGVDKSSASRLARTLAAHGYLQRDPASRRYRLGPKMRHAVIAGGAAGLRELARPFLYLLMKQSGECAHTAVHARGMALIIDDVESASSLRVAGGVGRLNPLHCTAVGKVFLAFGDAVPGGELEARTYRTITDHEALRRHIEAIREQGYTFDDEENEIGVRCLAAPVRGDTGDTLACIGISGPTTRVTDAALPRLVSLVLGVSRELSSALGYVDPGPQGGSA